MVTETEARCGGTALTRRGDEVACQAVPGHAGPCPSTDPRTGEPVWFGGGLRPECRCPGPLVAARGEHLPSCAWRRPR